MPVHLIRHGEVENPDHVVYADIPGFSLSKTGRSQAQAAGERLSTIGLGLVVSSPLDRAVETAALIAATTGVPIETDQRLTEWRLGVRWRGTRWPDLPVVFPGEVESYLNDPSDLPFSPESLDEMAARLTAAVNDWSSGVDTDIAIVSHQDPIHAGVLRLTGSRTCSYHGDKPEHCSISSLRRTGDSWIRDSYWAPEQ